MKTLIKGARLIDPANNLDAVQDILLDDGVVSAVGANLPVGEAEVFHAEGLVAAPGFVDIHVHLRDPGYEYKEDVVSGTRAAARGGFTSVAAMPNSNPVNDNKSVTLYLIQKARQEGSANVFPVGSITKGLKGETLSEMGDLKEAGCVGFSDDGRPVTSAEMMRRALEYAAGFDMPIISHAEELELVGSGVMNEGDVSTELGLKGIPWVAEDAATARDIMLAEFTGGRLHVAHVSTAGSVELIRQAKARGVRVTAEATPHHFTLTDEAVRGYDTNAKMNPPLRSQRDVEAICQGLADGTLDAVATDHAPHHVDEKNVEFAIAMNGVIGLETSLPLTLRLVERGVLTLQRAVELLTSGPCQALSIPRGTLSVGAAADLVLFDPDKSWTVSAENTLSKSKNTPFMGETMKGAVVRTYLAGKLVYSDSH